MVVRVGDHIAHAQATVMVTAAPTTKDAIAVRVRRMLERCGGCCITRAN
jgi:hypothetical protein